MIRSTLQSPDPLDDYTNLETAGLWTRFKDDPYVADFIPIDPIRGGSVGKTKAYIRRTNHFIQNLPRSHTLNKRIVACSLKSAIGPRGRIPVTFADTDKSHDYIDNLAEKVAQILAISELAKLRKQDDFVTILERLTLNADIDEADLEENKETLSSIEVLDLSKTYIATFPTTLSPYLSNVKSINLSGNDLGNTPLRFLDTLFRLPLLEELDLSFNSFSEDAWARIETLLPLLKNMQSINLAASNLEAAPNSFFETLFKLPHLKTLDISINELSIDLTVQIHSLAIVKEISVTA